MASKFKLDPAPTFEAIVEIPVPGGTKAPVKFTFKHLTKDRYMDLLGNPASPMPDVELILEICTGWELDDEFNVESVEKLRQNYQASMGAIVRKFVDELGPARLGN